MSKIVSGALIASDAAINVECGFVPDYVRLWTALGGTELVYDWFKALVDTDAGTGQYGILDTGGAKSTPSTAATGIIPYDANAIKLAFDNASGDGPDQFADPPSPWTKALSDAATARTTTALGDFVKPTSGNENGLVAECTTAGTGAASEPTWPTKPGDKVTDGTTVWTMRTTKVVQVGVKGFTIGVTVATDSEILVFKAEEHDRSEDMGDADSESPVRFES